MKKYLILFALLLCTSLFASAKDIYIAQSSTGSNAGTSCSTAHAVTFFNTSSNWGSGSTQIAAGDTVHLCGVVSSPLSFQGSGTSSAPITLLFESGASMQQPEWVTAAITFNGKSYLVIDGGSNGVIKNTNAGTGKNHQGSSCFQPDANSANVTIQNVECGPLYTRTDSSDSTQVGWGVSYPSGPNFTIKNSKFHDAYYCIQTGSGSASGLSVHDNEIYNCSTGIVVGDGGSGTTVNAPKIYNNNIHDGAAWDGCWSSCSTWNHNDGIHIWTSSGGTVSAPKVYSNWIHGDWGAHTTAFIFVEGDVGPLPNPMVYNNLLSNTGSNPTNGLVEMKEHITGGQLYNNTFDCGTSGFNAIHYEVGSVSSAQNNVFLNCDAAYANDGSGTMTHDYSAYWNTPTDSDSHKVTTNPQLGTSYIPSTSSSVVTAGANLTSSFTTDKAGLTRPASGAWDLGAYQASGSTSTTYHNLTVTTGGTGSGTVASTPAGINCPGTCTYAYAEGAQVTLAATSAPGSIFAGWGGACSGTGSCTVSMAAAEAVTASFTLSTTTTGGTTGGSGTTGTPNFVQGQACTSGSASVMTCTLPASSTAKNLLVLSMSWTGSATATVKDSLGSTWTQAVSQSWNNGSSTAQIFYATPATSGSSTVTVSFSGTVSYPSVYLHEYSGVATSSPLSGAVGSSTSGATLLSSGNTTTSTSNALLFGFGDSVNYTTAAGTGYVQRMSSSYSAKSEDAVVSTSGSYSASFTVPSTDSGVALLAAFKAGSSTTTTSSSYTLSVAKSGTGSGTVTSSPSGISCGSTCSTTVTSGTKVTLTAAPASGSTFAGWSGACSGTGTCTVTMSAATSVGAVFNSSTAAKISYVQGTSCTSPSTTSLKCTLPANVTAGDLLVVAISYTGNGTVTISDTRGNTWRQAAAKGWNSSKSATRIIYGVVPSSGAETMTFAISPAATYVSVYMHEYKGANTTSPFDVASSASGSGSKAASSGSATTTASNELVFGFADTANSTLTAGTGFTKRLTGAYAAASEDEIAATAGVTSANFTTSVADSWVALMATFKP